MARLPIRLASALAIAAFVLIGCGDNPAAPPVPELETTGTFSEVPRSIGDGTVHTWAELDDGIPVRIGATLSEDAFSGLPTSTIKMSIPLPAEARATTLFDHLLFDWNPNGHAPGDLYTVPHFDFHFYMISASERAEIPSGSFSARTPIPAQFHPRDYVPVAPLVGAMGEHWADSTSAEFEGAFDRTLIYVSYKGRILAIEPMITLEHFALRRDETLPIKQPEEYQRTGYYPMSYRIRYDEGDGAYHVTLEDFVEKGGVVAAPLTPRLAAGRTSAPSARLAGGAPSRFELYPR